MNAAAAAVVVVLPNCTPRFPTTIFSATSTETKFWKSNLLQKQEIADGASRLFRRNLLPSPLWSIRSDGNRSDRLPGRNSATSKPKNEDSNQYSFQTSDNESSSSSNKEEIIALFRRIQSSISKRGSPITQNRSPENSNKNQSAASILDVMLQSRKQLEGKSSNKFENKVVPQRTAVPSVGENMEDNSHGRDFKLTRPPSSFVKRSPIQMPSAGVDNGELPSTAIKEVAKVTSVDSSAGVDNGELPSTDIKEVAKVTSVDSSAGVDNQELQKVEDMKVSDLKELAKSKGLKGYSKLKKGELVDLLKGL